MLFQTFVRFFLMLNAKEDILNNSEEQFLVPTDIHVGKEMLRKSLWTINSLITSIIQNIFFYVQQKKETYTGLEWYEYEGHE